jgi:hypothetical protein
VAILGVGIWILADPNLQDYIDVIHGTDEQYFRQAAYLLIAFGAFIFLVGFCGCCGAIRKSKCLLGFVSTVFTGVKLKKRSGGGGGGIGIAPIQSFRAALGKSERKLIH